MGEGRLFLWLCFGAGAAVTAAGFFTPYDANFELANQVRPLTLAGFAAISALSFFTRSRLLRGACIAGLAVNSFFAASTLSTLPKASALTGQGEHLRIMAANLYYENSDAGAILAAIARAKPDIIVFSEYEEHHERQLNARLTADYPYSASCPRSLARCDLAVYSRVPLNQIEFSPYDVETPSMLTTKVRTQSGKIATVVAIHINYPGDAEKQVTEINWLMRKRMGWTGPIIIAGDFNLTPWTSLMTRLLSEAGLVRHGTFGMSWPVAGFTPNIPFVLLDNVLTTPDIKAVSFETGPELGSDHLPVIATVELP